MVTQRNPRRGPIRLAITTLILLAVICSAATAFAQGDDWRPGDRNRKGFLLGLNAGWGGSSFGYSADGKSVVEDPWHGPLGALRLGYAVSNSVAFTLENYGFGAFNTADDQDWGMGATLIAMTWWPDASGFFLRLGFGGGGGDVYSRDQGEKVHFEEAGAALFGMGYEWQLGRHFALGLAVDAVSFEIDDVLGHESDWAGMGGASIQFNWYL